MKTMTRRVHPAESTRKLVGIASGVALVGIVTGFQFSANAEESQQLQANSTATPTAVAPVAEAPTAEVAPEAVPAPATQEVAVPQYDPAAPAEAPAPAAEAPAPVAPAPAPVVPTTPVNGTTAGSGG